jgi:hypothetical protein
MLFGLAELLVIRRVNMIMLDAPSLALICMTPILAASAAFALLLFSSHFYSPFYRHYTVSLKRMHKQAFSMGLLVH